MLVFDVNSVLCDRWRSNISTKSGFLHQMVCPNRKNGNQCNLFNGISDWCRTFSHAYQVSRLRSGCDNALRQMFYLDYYFVHILSILQIESNFIWDGHMHNWRIHISAHYRNTSLGALATIWVVWVGSLSWIFGLFLHSRNRLLTTSV